VRALTQEVQLDGQLQLDQLISAFLKMARRHGFTLAEIRSRVKGWLGFQPPDHFLIIEPEPELRRFSWLRFMKPLAFPSKALACTLVVSRRSWQALRWWLCMAGQMN
jgi:hypothetical protein